MTVQITLCQVLLKISPSDFILPLGECMMPMLIIVDIIVHRQMDFNLDNLADNTATLKKVC